jgi:muramoyltetrapeptide carboxypeptidase LdcA involved in peptidoglycan recycling
MAALGRMPAKLDKIKGIVLGQFTQCDPSPQKDYVRAVFSARDVLHARLIPLCQRLKIPLVEGFQSGHGRPQMTFPLNVRVEVCAPKNGSAAYVDFLESPFV